MRPKGKKPPSHAGKAVDRAAQGIRVLIVDDHPLMRMGLRTLLEPQADIEVCAEADSATAAMRVIDSQPIDVMIIDLCMPGTSGIDLIRDLRAQKPGIPVLVVSMHDERLYAERVLRAGARGYIMKQENPKRILDGLRAVMRGELFISDRIATHLLHVAVGNQTGHGGTLGIDRLSDRELQVFEALGKGNSTRGIAEDLHLSVKTVETYRAHIKRKLGLENGNELMLAAARWSQGEDGVSG